jgi:hypothetical protein
MIFSARWGSDQSSISMRSEKDWSAAVAVTAAAHPKSPTNAHFLLRRIPANTSTALQHPRNAILIIVAPRMA